MDGPKLRPIGLDPVLFTSNIGCHKWRGTITFTDSTLGLSLTSKVLFELDRTTGWQISGTQTYNLMGPCTGGGSRTIQGMTGGMALASLAPKESVYHRAYWGAVSDNRTVTGRAPVRLENYQSRRCGTQACHHLSRKAIRRRVS